MQGSTGWNEQSTPEFGVVVTKRISSVAIFLVICWLSQCSTFTFHGTRPNTHFKNIRTSNTHNSNMIVKILFYHLNHNFTCLRWQDRGLGRLLLSYSYLTGVPAAHLSIMNVIKGYDRCSSKIRNIPNWDINKHTFIDHTPVGLLPQAQHLHGMLYFLFI